MTLVVAVPAAVAIVGALLYAFADKMPKLAEVGRAMLWCGLLVTLLAVAGRVVKL